MDEVTPPAGACKDQDYGNTRYLGESSMFPYGETQQRPSPEGGIAAHVLRNREMSPSSLQDFLEPEPVVDHLLELFWKFQASHIVIVDPIIFLRHRQQAQGNGGNGDRKFYTPCLLYSMLALASLIAPEKGVKRYATERGSVGDRFHRRARALFDMEMESPVVTTVQAAVLIGSWYGTFVDNSLGWIFSGIGFRMATKLGLHLDCSRMPSNGRMMDEEATYRSVAFWGCYIEDNAYCQRPTMLMDWDITISPPEERPMTDQYMPPNLLPHTVALAQICGRTLLALYAQRHFNDVNDNLKRIASEIHGQLWEWQRKLPHDLEWPADDQSSPSPPSVLVLHMEFYYNLILVHRPLLEFSKARDELSQDASHINSTTTCMMAAANITKLIHVYSQRYNIRQISPNGVHMAFIAATIHLINYRLTNVESHNRLLFMSVAALTELGDSYTMARKAVKILKSLIEGFRPLDEVSSQEEETAGDSIPNTNHAEGRNDSLAKHGGLSSNQPSFSVVPGVSSTQPSSDILTWKMQMCPDISFDFEVPLEIPQPMDVEGLVDQQHDERQSEQLSEPHPKAGGALYDVTAGIPWYGQTGTDFGDFDFGDLASSVNDTFALNMEDRDLFHTFYGAASSLY
ncbi:hypothetical protein N7528_005962 [Penicillium herquei]|nr:hypothetical protein N7528_005962 [Penicillium herquei]